MTKTPQKPGKAKASGKDVADEKITSAAPVENGTEKAAQEAAQPVADTLSPPAGKKPVERPGEGNPGLENIKSGDAEMAELQRQIEDPALEILQEPDWVIMIAAYCHDRNRAYCRSIGDDSQVLWDDARGETQISACHGVMFAIENAFPGPAQMHQNWVDLKIAAGWKFGDVKDADKKTHPCLVPYSALPGEQKKKDDIFVETVGVMATALIEGDDAVEAIGRLDWFGAEIEPLMPKLLQVDVVSYAAAVGQTAASRIFELLHTGTADPGDSQAWYRGGVAASEDEINQDIMFLTRYIIARNYDVKPETLFRFAAGEGIIPFGVSDYHTLKFRITAAYEQFCMAAGTAAKMIRQAQDELSIKMEAQKALAGPQPGGRDASDSNFEPHGSEFDLHSSVD